MGRTRCDRTGKQGEIERGTEGRIMKISTIRADCRLAMAAGSVLAFAACTDLTGPDSGLCVRTESLFFASGSCLELLDGKPLVGGSERDSTRTDPGGSP
jgi:hypothetical protein